MNTEIITIPSTVCVRLTPRERERDKATIFIEEKLLELTRIFREYKTWSDVLSKQLSRWSYQVFREGIEVKQERLSELALQLYQKILVSPFDQAPLKEPVLQADWTWEKGVLNLWKRCNSKSPFDNGEIVEVKEHSYAASMISWLKGFHLPAFQGAKLDVILQSKVNSPLVNALQMLSIATMAKNALMSEQLRMKEEHYEEQARVQCEIWEKANEKIEQEVRNAKEHAEERRRELLDEMEQMERIFHDTLQLLRDRLEDLKTELQIEKDKLRRAKETCRQQARRIDSLQAQIFCLAQRVKKLEGEVDRGGGLFGIF